MVIADMLFKMTAPPVPKNAGGIGCNGELTRKTRAQTSIEPGPELRDERTELESRGN